MESRRFTGTGRAHDGDDLSLFYLKTEVPDYRGMANIPEGHVFGNDGLDWGFQVCPGLAFRWLGDDVTDWTDALKFVDQVKQVAPEVEV